jgi:hypothetical protein
MIMLISGFILFTIGAFSFFSGFIITNLFPSWIPESLELPLSDLQEFSVDKNGNVYCAVPFYNRIQVYDHGGYFLRGWFVRPNTRFFRIRINADNNVEVARAPRWVKTYDIHGNLMNDDAKVHPEKVNKEFGNNLRRIFFHPNGSIYTLRGAFFIPFITIREPAEPEKVLITTPILSLLFPAPFRAIIYVAIGLFLFYLCERRNEEHSKKYIKLIIYGYALFFLIMIALIFIKYLVLT